MTLFDFRDRLVGENALASHASSPILQDGLTGKRLHVGILFLARRQVEIAHGNIQRVIEDLIRFDHRPGKAHHIFLQKYPSKAERLQEQTVPPFSIVPLGDGHSDA
jgi:hypothetical protein